MAHASRQLALDLALEPRLGLADFLVSAANRAAFDLLKAWPAWLDPVLVLVGPEGAGKTHLGAIWAERAGARTIAATDLPGVDLPDLMRSAAVLVEDADRIGSGEAALFHLVNLARETGVSVLLTGRGWPNHWGLTTPDLLSRLRLAPVIAIEPPDEAMVRAVLVKHFADRQLAVDTDVIDFLARRIDRSLGAVRAVVAAIDRESLGTQRPLTKPMASAILRAIGEELG
jgi:chromosomal replication initiation ATPase DnaA